MKKEDILSKYLPEGTAGVIARWIDYFQCEFKISRGRTTKLGDYRHPFRGQGHRISVNNNLNPYAFLVTTVHEFAHLLTWNEYQRRAKPHGAEWKHNFRRMMKPFVDQNVFPVDVHQAIVKYLDNPAAASCSDLQLSRALKKYDVSVNATLKLEDLPVNTVFSIKDGRKFSKGERLRKRYRCLCLNNGKIYLFNPLAEVLPASTGT